MLARLRGVVPAVVGFVLFVAALEVLRSALRTVTWPELARDILSTPAPDLGLALLFTVLNYAVLTGYDFLALASIGRRLPPGRIALTSFLAYAIANNVGWAMLSGASVRYRFYTRWGLTAEELVRIVISYSVTFWIGLLLLGGLSLAAGPTPAALNGSLRTVIAPFGWLLSATSLGYVAAAFFRREPIRIGRFELALPAPPLAVTQLLVSAVDWTLAAAVLYVLLPASSLTFLGLLGMFVAAQLLGLASHVPGGVGGVRA